MFQLGESEGTGERLEDARRAARHLVLFFAAKADPTLAAMTRLLEILTGRTTDDGEDGVSAYHHLFRLLAEEVEFCAGEVVGNAWQHHLLDRMLGDDNAFSRKAALSPDGTVSDGLRAAARQDLRRLQVLFNIGSPLLRAALREQEGAGEEDLAPWEELGPMPGTASRRSPEECALMHRFLADEQWPALAEDLARYYAHAGSGVFLRYRAFRWVADPAGGHLEGVAYPDQISLEDLIGYDTERRLLLRNTEHFLAGHPANNVLLYGDRGTGKSSSVKALLNTYGDRGLRLIEVHKHHLSAFPRILDVLRGHRERFILFVDDLSFEEHETYYKDLKAVLEGGLESRPANVLLYATSNRRHLVNERFSDREGHDEIHPRDTSQEKLSLSDRFGVTITFLSPDQRGYLSIVEGLATRAGLTGSPEDLRRRALQWAARHNGWSGRSARQFIDYALGEQAVKREA